MNVAVDIQGRTWPGLAWVWLIVVTLMWTQLYRVIGRERVTSWALNGCFRLCWYRVRVGSGPWGRWRRVYRRDADDFRVSDVPLGPLGGNGNA